MFDSFFSEINSSFYDLDLFSYLSSKSPTNLLMEKKKKNPLKVPKSVIKSLNINFNCWTEELVRCHKQYVSLAIF
jgi:hypothetical protein